MRKLQNNALSSDKRNRRKKIHDPLNTLDTCHVNVEISDMKSAPSHSSSSSLYSAVNFAYSSVLIRLSISPLSFTCILAIHPSPSGLLFIVPGFSCSTLFASMIFPDMGVKISDADLTDSTAPMESPAFTSRSRAGSSTKTTSPRFFAA